MNNLDCWRALQDANYFERHHCYRGYLDAGPYDIEKIEAFVPLRQTDTVVVIGCGYGRECVHIAPRVHMVYGIDVSARILRKAENYLVSRGVTNFIPVPVDGYAGVIHDGIDLVYSLCVLQHLSRDLVRRYLADLAPKLNGSMVLQFLDQDGTPDDAQMKVYEPAVSWTPEQIAAAAEIAGLKVAELRTDKIRPDCLWHWAHLTR